MEVDAQYPKKLHELHRDLPFLPEKTKVKKRWKTCSQYLRWKEYVTNKKINNSNKH